MSSSVAELSAELELTFPRKLYRPAALAELLNCTSQHIYNLIDEGGLRAVNLATDPDKMNPYYRVSRDEIIRFLLSRDTSAIIERIQRQKAKANAQQELSL